MKILLMGPPGSGKGTQATELKSILNIPHISSGDMFRDAISNKTELGTLAKSFIDKGELVPDEVTNGIVAERLQHDDCKNGFILDGYPRTIPQAKTLESNLKATSSNIDLVINFNASNEVLIARLTGRRICKSCGATYHTEFSASKKEDVCDSCGGNLYQRPDDNKETAVNRLDVYTKQTKPLLDFYNEKGIVVNINSEQSKSDVLNDVKKQIEAIK